RRTRPAAAALGGIHLRQCARRHRPARVRQAATGGAHRRGIAARGHARHASARCVSRRRRRRRQAVAERLAGCAAEAMGRCRARVFRRVPGRHVVRERRMDRTGAAGAAGFHGGIESYLLVPRKASWKSTEHNIDLAAMFAWLTRISAPGGDWNAQARRARGFVALQWDAASGHFWTGTEGDGATPLRSPSALDVQLWAQLLPDAPKAWRHALDWVERMHAVKGGFAFTDARDGMWTEGTAQAALAWRWVGDEARADVLFASIAQQASPGGFLYATPQPRVVALYAWYYHRPCLAATAWAVIAASNRNPYLPNRALAIRHPR